MKKVLITGATSSQASAEAHKRSTRFSGLLNSAFTFSGHDSEIKSLPIDATKNDIKDYSTIIVGLAPFTSLSANKMYTALNTLSIASESSAKFQILFDAPEPHLVYQSFKSVLANPTIFTKELYKNRDGYGHVTSNSAAHKRLMSAIEFVLSGEYDVITPSLPYFEGGREAYGIPTSAAYNTYQYNFDGLFSSRRSEIIESNSKFWLAESATHKWAVDMSKTLAKPVLNVRRSQYDNENDYISRMQKAYGYLLNTYKNGTPWWSPNIALAFSCVVPVFSDWRHTGSLGMYWSALPYTVESMSREERYELSVQQADKYFSKIPDWNTAAKSVVQNTLM